MSIESGPEATDKCSSRDTPMMGIDIRTTGTALQIVWPDGDKWTIYKPKDMEPMDAVRAHDAQYGTNIGARIGIGSPAPEGLERYFERIWRFHWGIVGLYDWMLTAVWAPESTNGTPYDQYGRWAGRALATIETADIGEAIKRLDEKDDPVADGWRDIRGFELSYEYGIPCTDRLAPLRYVVEYEHPVTQGMSVTATFYETLAEANATAQTRWDSLSDADRARSRIRVGFDRDSMYRITGNLSDVPGAVSWEHDESEGRSMTVETTISRNGNMLVIPVRRLFRDLNLEYGDAVRITIEKL